MSIEVNTPTGAGETGRRWMRRLVVLAVASCLVVVTGRRLLTPSPDPEQMWVEGERALRSGRLDAARQALARLERLRSRTGLDWMLEAQVALAGQDGAAALAALERIDDGHAIAPQARLLAGRILRESRRIKQAEASFRRAIDLKPGLVDAHKELIYILGIQSRRTEVDAEFRALARLTPLSHHDLFTWALTHFTHWNPDVVQDLDGFIRADPTDRDSRLAVVELLLERPEVEEYVTRILAPLPNSDPDALALRINLAFNLGRLDQAETLLASAPDDHPRIARIRGELALRRHDLDAAIRYFKQALSSAAYDRVSPMQLARALRLRGDEAEADVYLDRVQRLNTIYNLIVRVKSETKANQNNDLAELGQACERAGLIDEARGWYKLAINMDPLDRNSQSALFQVDAAAAAKPASATP
jgi:tetratricopeptide (TPR) repeat protein